MNKISFEQQINNLDKKQIITLIGIYIILSDKSIDDKEIKVLFNYNRQIGEIRDLIDNIIFNSVDKIPLKSLATELNKASKAIVKEAYNLFFEIIYSDGFYDKDEKTLLLEIRENLKIDKKEFLEIETKVANNVKIYFEKEENWTDDIKIGFYSIMDSLTSSNKYENKKKDILLNGSKFVKKIKDISHYAKFDLDFSESIIKESSTRMSNLLKELETHIEKLSKSKRRDEQLDEFVTSLQSIVENSALNQLAENIEVLNKKRKSVDYFTISFLGRTKAGKSTLHSIITKEGENEIGEGKLRTTRNNRVYNWENLRIIDTPGIGAPNGETDVKIAESIIDESDLICYLVTNDAIQETEFKFLSKIKKKNKPVVILLNVKENIENESRKKIFLKNPLKWKERTDQKSIQGHLERINEYMNKYYNNNFYRVLPIMLLSAKLSENEADKEIRSALFNASNVTEFLTFIKDSVFKYGHLRKSQNIIDGTNVRLSNIRDEFSNQLLIVTTIIGKLKKEKKSFSSYIKDMKPKSEKMLTGIIDTYAFKLNKFARDFAVNNYALNKKEVEKMWSEELEKRNYRKQLDDKIKLEFLDIQNEIKNRLQESLDNFELYFNNVVFDLKTNSTFNTKTTASISGIILTTVGGIVGMASPIGLALIIGGVVVTFSTYLFTSKEKKIKNAQEKLEASLIKGIGNLKQEYKEQTIDQLSEILSKYDKAVTGNMSELIRNANIIKVQLQKEIQKDENQIDELNQAMMCRVFQHTRHIKHDGNINECVNNSKNAISSINRDFNTNKIELTTTYKINPKTIENISQLLQVELKINN
jgi:predicted GTPase